MDTFILLALFSGIGITAGLFAAGYFFFINNEKPVQLSLGVLFFAIALRIGKSVFYYLIPEMSLFGISVGFLGLSMTGPALLFHVQCSTGIRVGIRKTDFAHLIIPLSGFLAILAGFSPNAPMVAYTVGTLLLLVYLIIAVYSGRGDTESWNYWLIAAVFLIWVALAYQLISDTILNYAYGAAFAALMIYALIFRMLRNPTMFKKGQEVKVSPGLIDRVVRMLEEEKYYRRSSLTLTGLSQQLQEPAYLISKAVKSHYGKKFPEAINALRVKEVKRRLSTGQDSFSKVEGIAYEAGFNTPSAFYAAFKKETSSTPRAYQKSLTD